MSRFDMIILADQGDLKVHGVRARRTGSHQCAGRIEYATCHWCHVMERESFEDPEVADRMNAAFVSVKVELRK